MKDLEYLPTKGVTAEFAGYGAPIVVSQDSEESLGIFNRYAKLLYDLSLEAVHSQYAFAYILSSASVSILLVNYILCAERLKCTVDI